MYARPIHLEAGDEDKESCKLKKIGSAASIYRYPVKSFSGESLAQVRVETYGLQGDRSRAFVDDTEEGFARYYTARQIPEMLSFSASMEADERDGFSPIRITAPDGKTYGWDEALLARMQQYAPDRGIRMISYERDDAGLLSVDAASVLLVSDASLRELERRWGRRLDARRFRANVIAAVDSGRPFDEEGWIGKRLSFGDAEFTVTEACGRCMMIGYDPDTLERDASLPRLVQTDRAGCFGVYASVSRTGVIRAGDPIVLLD